MTKLALFDMDGTLSDDAHRNAEYEVGKYSSYWDSDKMLADPAYPEALQMMEDLLADDWAIGVLTARLERNLATTKTWLDNFDLSEKVTGPIVLRPEWLHHMRAWQFKPLAMRLLTESKLYSDIILVEDDYLVSVAVHQQFGAGHIVRATWK